MPTISVQQRTLVWEAHIIHLHLAGGSRCPESLHCLGQLHNSPVMFKALSANPRQKFKDLEFLALLCIITRNEGALLGTLLHFRLNIGLRLFLIVLILHCPAARPRKLGLGTTGSKLSLNTFRLEMRRRFPAIREVICWDIFTVWSHTGKEWF